MNIFKVLSRGDGTIQEPNITSVLSYLLDPTENHGLGNLFLKRFIERLQSDGNLKSFENELNIIKKSFENSDTELNTFIEVEKRLEKVSENLELQKNTRDLDVFIEIFKGSNILLRLIIEIKIYKEAYTENQLNDIFVLAEDNFNDNKNIYLLIAPDSDKLKNKKFGNDKFIRLDWNSDLSEIIIKILKNDNEGEISPVNLQTKDLLKSFNVFINDGFKDKEHLYPDILSVAFEVGDSKVEFNGSKILEFIKDVLKQILKDKEDIQVKKEKIIEINSKHKRLNDFALSYDKMKEKLISKTQKQKLDFLYRRRVLDVSKFTLSDRIRSVADFEKFDSKTSLFISTEFSASGKDNKLLFFLETIKQVFTSKEITISGEKLVFFGINKPKKITKNTPKDQYYKEKFKI